MNGDEPYRLGGELGQQFDERRRRLEQLPQLKLYQPPAAPPLTPADPGYLLERLQERARKDLRHPARRTVDEGWKSLLADAQRRFGRTPSVDPWNLPDAGARMALEEARAAEDNFLSVAMASPAPSQGTIDAVFLTFTAAVTRFLNAATMGWPSAAAKADADAHHARLW